LYIGLEKILLVLPCLLNDVHESSIFSNILGFKNDLFFIQKRAAEIKNKSRLNLEIIFFGVYTLKFRMLLSLHF